MDTAAFATWLGGIGLLDPAQRGEAFRELALAEADDPIDPSAHAVDAAVLPCEAAVAPSLPVAAAPEEDLLSKVGRGRIARFGCPHCGRDDVRPWGKAGGKPRYRCTSCRSGLAMKSLPKATASASPGSRTWRRIHDLPAR